MPNYSGDSVTKEEERVDVGVGTSVLSCNGITFYRALKIALQD